MPRRYKTMVEIASDPTTDPTRLANLARSRNEAVAREAQKNPSLPEEILVPLLEEGRVAAWSSPQVPFLLLTHGQTAPLEAGAKGAVFSAPSTAKRDPEFVANVHGVLSAWWKHTAYPARMLSHLDSLMRAVPVDADFRRRVVAPMVSFVEVYVEMLPSANTGVFKRAIGFLRAWTQGENASPRALMRPIDRALAHGNKLRPSETALWNALLDLGDIEEGENENESRLNDSFDRCRRAANAYYLTGPKADTEVIARDADKALVKALRTQFPDVPLPPWIS